jgi:hypothetical protein
MNILTCDRRMSLSASSTASQKVLSTCYACGIIILTTVSNSSSFAAASIQDSPRLYLLWIRLLLRILLLRRRGLLGRCGLLLLAHHRGQRPRHTVRGCGGAKRQLKVGIHTTSMQINYVQSSDVEFVQAQRRGAWTKRIHGGMQRRCAYVTVFQQGRKNLRA